MSKLEETTLQQLGLCEHRYPSVVVVPKGETFVLVRWCIRCGTALFDEYDDEPELNVEEM